MVTYFIKAHKNAKKKTISLIMRMYMQILVEKV